MRPSLLPLLGASVLVAACSDEVPLAPSSPIRTLLVAAPAGAPAPLTEPGAGSSSAFGTSPSGIVVGSLGEPGSAAPAIWSAAGDALPLASAPGAAQGASDAGVVVGFVETADGSAAFRWSARSGLATLAGSGGASASASAINPRGDIAGAATTPDGTQRAVLWPARGGTIDLGTLGGASASALGIAESGSIVGGAETTAGELHAFVWRRGAMRDLGTLGGALSVAFAIADDETIVGASTTAVPDEFHAVVWSGGAARDLGTLGGSLSVALATNGEEVVGYSTRSSGLLQPFHWSASTGMTALRPLADGAFAIATGIDDDGNVVGYGAPAPGSQEIVALRWTR